MTRYIANLPQWDLEDLENLRLLAIDSIDGCNAAGDPNSSIITMAQFHFLEKLIERKKKVIS